MRIKVGIITILMMEDCVTKAFLSPKLIIAVLAISTLSACSKDTPSANQAPVKATTTPPKPTLSPEEVMLQKGRKLFARCRACHTLNEGGKNKVGPNLWHIFGRKAGTAEGFAYSKAMLAADIIWTEDTLSSYLENPKVFLPKNKMAFPGLRKEADREALVEYLEENTK